MAEQWLALGGDQETPLMVLSGASRAHFVVISADLMAGVPYVPMSSRIPGILSGWFAGFRVDRVTGRSDLLKRLFL